MSQSLNYRRFSLSLFFLSPCGVTIGHALPGREKKIRSHSSNYRTVMQLLKWNEAMSQTSVSCFAFIDVHAELD